MHIQRAQKKRDTIVTGHELGSKVVGADSSQSSSVPADGPDAPQASHRSTTVLILEDEPTLLELITEMLAQKGLDVTPADTVNIARDHLAASTFDLFLTDIVVQGEFSGASLAREAHEAGRADRIVVMSGHPKQRALAGQDDTSRFRFLKKPFSYDELLAIIAEE